MEITAQLELLRPEWLLLLGGIPVLALATYARSVFARSVFASSVFASSAATGVGVGLARRTVVFLLRSLLLVLVALACTGPRWKGESAEKMTVALIDVSDSMANSEQARANAFLDQVAKDFGPPDNLRRIEFSSTPQGWSPEGAAQSPPGTGETDIAAALPELLELAQSNFNLEMILLSDGLETRGSILAATVRLGMPVHTVPLKAFSYPEAAVESVILPHSCRLGSAVEAVATIRSNRDGEATLLWHVNGEQVQRQPISIQDGLCTAAFSLTMSSDEATLVEASVQADWDTRPENNRCTSVVFREEEPPVLIVAPTGTDANRLAGVIESAGGPVRAIPPDALPRNVEDFPANGAIVLAGISASQLVDRTEVLKQYVAQGRGGLVVIGGEETFAADRYDDSPLEALLPVQAVRRQEERPHVLALVLVIDKSSSMEKERRMELAKVAAKKTIGVLQPHDLVGVLAYGTHSEWVADLGPAADQAALRRKIDGLQAKGVTNMYPAMLNAYHALDQAIADRRHCIIVTDGVSSPGEFDELAAKMAKRNITVATVSVGEGADQTILKDIAQIAGGRHHHCNDPADVPKILERETRTAAGPPESTAFRPSVLRSLPGLSVAGAPPLAGYAATSPKPHCEILLTAEGDPLLAWGRHGRGVTVALTTPMQNAWLSWDQYGAFWRRLIRHAAPARQKLSTMQTHVHGDRAIVVVDARGPDGNWLNGAVVSGRCSRLKGVSSEATSTPLAFSQVAPGQYRAEFPIERMDAWEIIAEIQGASSASAQNLRGFVCYDYAEEYRLRDSDEDLLQTLARQTGGKFTPTPEQLLKDDGRRAPVHRDLFHFFLLAAAVLLVVEVAVRQVWAG